MQSQAFSHFTWEESKHKVLVCDLQGVGDLWTDPQIHSADGRGYGKGNMGMKGIHAFLQNHRCNAICTALKLPVVGRAPKPDAQGTKLQPALYKPEATLAQCKAQYLLGGLLQSAALPGRKKKKEHRSGGNEADRIQVIPSYAWHQSDSKHTQRHFQPCVFDLEIAQAPLPRLSFPSLPHARSSNRAAIFV